jgi:hypothetical protein
MRSEEADSVGIISSPIGSGPPFFPIRETDHHPVTDTFTPISSIPALFQKSGFFDRNPCHPLFLLLVFHKGAADYDDVHG